MRGWTPKLIPLNRGVEQDVPSTALSAAPPAPFFGDNLDFSYRGGVRGRPGLVRPVLTFAKRGLDANGLPTDATFADLEATGYAEPQLITVRDPLGERPGLVTRGRLYTYDGTRWNDRLGCTTARWERLAETKAGLNPSAATAPPFPIDSTTVVAGGTYDFLPGSSGAASSANQTQSVTLLTSDGTPATSAVVSTGSVGPSCGARCGNITGFLTASMGNDVYLITRNNGAAAVTTYLISTNCLSNGVGDAPVLCCDYDETHFFVAHWVIGGAVGDAVVKRVNPSTGAITHTQTVNFGAGVPRGLWLTNTAAATNRLIIAMADSVTAGVFTRVLSSSALVNQAIDVTLTSGVGSIDRGQVVLGIAEAGEVWVVWVDTAGTLHIRKRSTSAATSTTYQSRAFGNPATVGSIRQLPAPGVGGNFYQMSCFLQHQPVKIGGRHLLGLATTRGGNSGVTPAATWSVHDITDLWRAGVTQTGSVVRDPVCVARGDLDASTIPWGPVGAVVAPNGAPSYRFPTMDYKDFIQYTSSFGVEPWANGLQASVGLNEVTLDVPTAAHYRGSTLITGAVPRALSGGVAHPVHWPFGELPMITAVAGAGGSLGLGSYTLVAVWAWTDEAGQVHRSTPSFGCTVNTTAGQRLQSISVQAPHFNERETGTVYSEVYCTPLNGTAASAHFLQSRVAYDYTSGVINHPVITAVETRGEVLYTDGGVLETNFVGGDGGLAVVGERCWISDGRRVLASRLSEDGVPEAPSWHADDSTLEVDVPGVAGRVVALSALDDKLVILCERGIWVTNGVGPDNLGQGPAFLTPVRVADVGVAGARLVASTPKGVFFESRNTGADGSFTGGLWLLDRGLSVQPVSQRVHQLTDVSMNNDTLIYVPERERVMWTRREDALIAVYDLRADAWSTWAPSGATEEAALGLTTLAAVEGVAWAAGLEPCSFSGTPGTDALDVGGPYGMSYTLDDIPVVQDPGGWGRVRSVRVLGDVPLTAHDLEVTVTQDEGRSFSALFTSIPTAAADTDWFTRRYDPVTHLPVQKCGLISVTLLAQPATALWTGLELLVKDSGARSRSRDNKIGA